MFKIMKQKKDDATETVKVEDSKYHKTMKELKTNITDDEIREGFSHFKHQEAELMWKTTKGKMESIIKHLEILL